MGEPAIVCPRFATAGDSVCTVHHFPIVMGGGDAGLQYLRWAQEYPRGG